MRNKIHYLLFFVLTIVLAVAWLMLEERYAMKPRTVFVDSQCYHIIDYREYSDGSIRMETTDGLVLRSELGIHEIHDGHSCDD